MAEPVFRIREMVPADASGVARVHVKAFVETHGGPGPALPVREWQWREAFAGRGANWFGYVIEAPDGELAGFAKGVPYTGGLPGFAGELNKIYLLRKYHRQGLGRQLIGHVARRFLEQGITAMLLFGEAGNPSNGFYEALGADRLFSDAGEFHGGYGWRDLQKLADQCAARC